MEKTAIKRIINKDMKEIEKQNLKSLGIYIDFNEENILQAKAMIVGPKDSLYEGGFLFFNIQFPKNYPFAPPDITYISRNKIRIHPNIYVGSGTDGLGKVCLSILGTWSGPKWTTIMDISTVLLTLQSLLDTNPLQHEPGFENKREAHDLYNQVIKHESIKTLLIKNITDIPHGYEVFLEDMKNEFMKYKDLVTKKLEVLKTEKTKHIRLGMYRIDTYINYHDLYTMYTSLKTEYEK